MACTTSVPPNGEETSETVWSHPVPLISRSRVHHRLECTFLAYSSMAEGYCCHLDRECMLAAINGEMTVIINREKRGNWFVSRRAGRSRVRIRRQMLYPAELSGASVLRRRCFTTIPDCPVQERNPHGEPSWSSFRIPTKFTFVLKTPDLTRGRRLGS
jgi:hypothetical protein